MSGDWLAMGAVAALAAAGLVRRKGGSRIIDAHKTLRAYVQNHDGLLSDYYPQTAAGNIQPHGTEDVYWSGGWNRYGVTGPTDGTMVPIEAKYLHPMPLNIFDFDKLASLVNAINAGEEPIVHSGYAQIGLVGRQDIQEGREYAEDTRSQSYAEPYEDEDIGALVAQVRDGNHRTFAGIIAGADVAWVKMSDNDKNDLIEHRGSSRTDRLYTAIRKAQRSYGAPVFTRPRHKPVRRTAALDQAEVKYQGLKVEIENLFKRLYARYEHMSPEPSAHDPMERPQLFFGILLRRLEDEHGIDLLNIMLDRQDAEYKRIREARREKEKMRERVWSLRQKAGLDFRGNRTTR